MSFNGFDPAACGWFEDLARHNNKDWFTANRALHREGIVGPMQALLDEAQAKFGGETKIFRANRDVRFSKDKSPYHLHQRGLVHSVGVMAIYTAIDAEGFYAGMGVYGFEPARLRQFRAAVAAEGGESFARIVADIETVGIPLSGERLKTVPRGFDADHPRADLLKQKAIIFGRRSDAGSVSDAEAVRAFAFETWTTIRPADDWLFEAMGPKI